MSQKPIRKVIHLQPGAQPLVGVASATRTARESRPVEMRLFLVDLLLLFTAACLMAGLTKLLDPMNALHEGLMVALNLTLALGFGFAFRYLDLTDGRYSLGKALLMGLSLWLMNGSVLWFLASDIPLASLGLTALLYFGVSLLSGVLHYQWSEPFAVCKKDSPYFRLECGIKRAFDFTASSLGLIAVSPLMLLVLVLLCLESKGSPLFKQSRIGRGEKTFSMYKFRSMVLDAEKMPQEKKAVLFKRDDDPRVTRLGRLIRKLSIDELPQLWNVVQGEMSLVGPRPPVPHEYELMNWYHRRKFEATPGMTGLWQVIGRAKNQRDFNSVAAYDVHYIETWSLMLDMQILLQTIPVVLLQKGAS